MGQDATFQQTWVHEQSGMFAVTGVEVAPVSQARGNAVYHLSVSQTGERCSAAQVFWALAEFGLLDAQEDNFSPGGRVRNFSLMVRCSEDEAAPGERTG